MHDAAPTFDAPAGGSGRRRRSLVRGLALLGVAIAFLVGSTSSASARAEAAVSSGNSAAAGDESWSKVLDAGGEFSAADEFGPDIFVFIQNAMNEYGWYNTPQLLIFICDDAEDGVAVCPSPVVVNEGDVVPFRAVDGLGNVHEGVIDDVPIDQTPPTIDVTNNGASFSQAGVITLGCNVSDNRSGIIWESNPCPAWGEPGENYELDATYWGDVEATDAAGNYTRANVNFTVVK